MEIVSKIGNYGLMKQEKTAFVCSRKTPDGLEYLVGKWMLGLSAERDCVMCGSESPMERAVFTVLLQRKIPAVLVLAEAMHSRWDEEVNEALRENRLLIITHCDASVHNVTARSAFDRNIFMMSLAQKIVVGYCTKGGKLERALAGFDNVEYLENGQVWLKMPGEPVVEDVVEKPVQTRLGSWERQLRLNRGYIFLDFNDSGAETYFKITYSIKGDKGAYEREKLFFDRKELSGFLSAIRQVNENLVSGSADWQGITVASLSGEITFSDDKNNGSEVLNITQTKEYNGGKLRINTVALAKTELPMLIKGVEEALAEWK